MALSDGGDIVEAAGWRPQAGRVDDGDDTNGS